MYLGTENKLYYRLMMGAIGRVNVKPSHTPMYWIDIQEHFNDLVIGTYGRGIWILDDTSPLQQLNQDVTKECLSFDLKSSYRFQNVTSTLQMFRGILMPRSKGASINYWLNEDKDVG